MAKSMISQVCAICDGLHHFRWANRLLFIVITTHNSRSLSALHDTSARARAHQHLIRKRHGVQQKKCLWSSETTGLSTLIMLHASPQAPRLKTASKFRRMPPCQWSDTRGGPP